MLYWMLIKIGMVAYAYAFLCNNFWGVPWLLRVFVFSFALPFLSLLSTFSNFIFILTTGTWHFLVFCKNCTCAGRGQGHQRPLPAAKRSFWYRPYWLHHGKEENGYFSFLYTVPTSDHYRTNDSDDLAIVLLHEISLQVHNIHLAKSNHSNGRNYLS